MELRYGILSTSSIAPRFIAAVRESKTGTVAALSSRTWEKAHAKAKEWNIPTAYGSHEALLSDETINIVYISNVNARHYPWAKAALLAGKHVICEKPCTTTQAHTKELYELAREKGLFFMEAQKMLFLPAVLAVKEHLADLGDVTMAQCSHSFPGSYNGWMFDAEAGGGPLLSSGIYALQLMAWLFGGIGEVSGTASKLPTGVEWQYILTGCTKTGILFSAKNSTRAVLDNTCRIFGERGYIELPEYWKARKAVFHIDGKTEVLEFPCEHELVYEVRHIAQCLEQGLLTSPVITEDLSLQAIRAIEKIKAEW
ncbi:MAG: Gfo/Idh/MocA family oxidoreductase [Oscillospiraceae bacterium]|nr:Gfo/Idh/MocA family oxidoreductase [Oscillospiraceae bacterium]